MSTSNPVPAARPREYGLDWLRVFAFALLILYHTGMFFTPDPDSWCVKNPERSHLIRVLMNFSAGWRLSLLFFISGGGVFFSLRSRGYGRFAAERVRRLLLPLAFAMLVIVPPQIYYERLADGQHFDSYFAFWKTVFRFVPYPEGNLSWHHLWFVAYIFVYSIVCLPLFALLRGAQARAAIDRLADFCRRPGAIYLINLPNIAVSLWLGPHWPTTHNLVADWANLTGALLTFLWGFILCGSERFLTLIEHKRREFLIFALVMTAIYYGAPRGGLLGAVLIGAYFGMAWIFTLVGYSRAKLNHGSRALSYATEAVYPFYIAHQTITVTIAYYMIDWRAPIAVKFLLLATGTFLGSWAVFELARRTPITRLLMGIKPTKVL